MTSTEDPMLSTIDHVGSEKSYGYTKDEDGTIWYWEWDGEEVAFSARGTPTDHPIRSGDVPEAVRDHAETYVDASIEETETPWY